ncbi:MAG: hypothetical protein HYW45_02535 [Candidatus Daviesbacteria bacterium]|nr:MAG: hypothetical protein HYW45_02535 [Candidatus Daviesbacteria bacterium]
MAEQFKDQGTIAVLSSDQPAPIKSGSAVSLSNQLVSVTSPGTLRRVRITKVEGLPDLHHESADIEVAKKAAELCKIAGIRRSIVARHLHEGHGYELLEAEGNVPFQAGEEGLIEDMRVGESGFVSWQWVEDQPARMLPGRAEEKGLVVLSQTLDGIREPLEKIIDLTAVSVKKQVILDTLQLKKAV